MLTSRKDSYPKPVIRIFTNTPRASLAPEIQYVHDTYRQHAGLRQHLL